MTHPSLPLNDMSERHPGLIPSIEDTYKKSAAVILDNHYHPPQEFVIKDDDKETTTIVSWDISDERTKAALANRDDAKRDGAYIIALAATELCRGLVALGRTETLSGADYYVAPIGTRLDDLENAYKLEVSGTELTEYEVKRRIKEKVQQAGKGNLNLPALAAVVGYSIKLIFIRTVEK